MFAGLLIHALDVSWIMHRCGIGCLASVLLSRTLLRLLILPRMLVPLFLMGMLFLLVVPLFLAF
jgi:hypothetical protein